MSPARDRAPGRAGTSGTSIRRHADPFSLRHLFAILNGRAPSMLELPDRPAAYYDVGRLMRVGDGAAPAAERRARPAAGHEDGMAGRIVRSLPRSRGSKERAAYWGAVTAHPQGARPAQARTAAGGPPPRRTTPRRPLTESRRRPRARLAAASRPHAGNGRTRVSETAPRAAAQPGQSAGGQSRRRLRPRSARRARSSAGGASAACSGCRCRSRTAA